MKITLNGQPKTFINNNKSSLNINDILTQEGLTNMMIAVAHNGTVIPIDNYAKTPINEGDQIEIVAPMQGG